MVRAIRPSPLSETRRALDLERQKRSRVQKKYGEILTKEALQRFSEAAKIRDTKKKILKEANSSCKKNRFDLFINPDVCNICKQVDPPQACEEKSDEENVNWIACDYCTRWFHFACVDDINRPCSRHWY